MSVRSTSMQGPRSLSVLRTVGVLGTAAALTWAMTGSAFAAPGPSSSSDTTVANVEVTTSIDLTGLTDHFTLTGIPGATVTNDGAVTMNVKTNSFGGYAVTVQSATDSLLPADSVANVDSIPIDALLVHGTTGTYTPLSDTAPFTVHTQATRSAELGDTITNGYQVVIPFVNEDTYTATLNYVANAL